MTDKIFLEGQLKYLPNADFDRLIYRLATIRDQKVVSEDKFQRRVQEAAGS